MTHQRGHALDDKAEEEGDADIPPLELCLRQRAGSRMRKQGLTEGDGVDAEADAEHQIDSDTRDEVVDSKHSQPPAC